MSTNQHPETTQPGRVVSLKQTGAGYQIEISALPEPLLVDSSLVYRHRLKEGIVLTEPQIAQLQNEAQCLACDNAAIRILAIREHTIGELRTKLRKRQFDSDVIDVTLKDLIRRGLLDDAHVAAKLVEQSLARNPSGQAYLVAMLRRKKVARELAGDTVRRALAQRDETQLAVESLRRRWSAFSRFDLERARTKAYNYLSRRGISYSAARSAFEQLYDRQNQQHEGSDD